MRDNNALILYMNEENGSEKKSVSVFQRMILLLTPTKEIKIFSKGIWIWWMENVK